MKLYCCNVRDGNFGDDLNRWLWPKVIPRGFDGSDNALFVGIGTLLNADLPRDHTKIIFGSGCGYGEPAKVDNSWHVFFVRGPLTARMLGLEEKVAVTDAAILVSKLVSDAVPKQHRAAFMPHHALVDIAEWQGICDSNNVHYIDPRLPVPTILESIASTELLFTEALHGAIVADALRVPWVAIRSSPLILEFKWVDWCTSMGLNYSPVDLWMPWQSKQGSTNFRRIRTWARHSMVGVRLRQIIANARPVLSANADVETSVDQIEHAIHRLNVRISAGEYS